MRVYQLDKITSDVRQALNHNVSSALLEEIGDVDTLSFNDIIRSKIVEAVKRVHSEAPVHLLDGGNNFGDAVYWDDHECGWVLLPEDFMRLVVFEMDDWSRAVFSAPMADTPEYVSMRAGYKGLRGTAERPQCFVSFRPEGRVLEFYSCKSDSAMVSRAVYLPFPVLDKYGAIEICERCYDAVVYTIASLVSIILGDKDKGALLSELAKSTLL